MASKAQEVQGIIVAERLARPRGWDRSALVRFFVGASAGSWAKLPAHPTEALSAEGRARGNARGYIVPAECFGRDVDQSQANSLRAYIRDVVFVAMARAGITPPPLDKVATMLEERDGESVVVIYRRA